MASNFHTLRISTEDREAFVLCLALGTLAAMRSKAWHPDAGIWTIGRPAFQSILRDAKLPADVLAVFQIADELTAIQDLSGTNVYLQRLDESIATLVERLREHPNRFWNASWTDGDADGQTTVPASY